LELQSLALGSTCFGNTQAGALIQCLDLLPCRAALLWGAALHSITQSDAFNRFAGFPLTLLLRCCPPSVLLRDLLQVCSAATPTETTIPAFDDVRRLTERTGDLATGADSGRGSQIEVASRACDGCGGLSSSYPIGYQFVEPADIQGLCTYSSTVYGCRISNALV
jgi:hypothetical protein